MGITYAEYMMLMQRASPAAGGHKESALHRAICEICDCQGWLYFHGNTGKPTHRTIGEPDFTVLLPGGRVLFAEVKTANGKLTPEQEGILRWARKLGHTIHVVRSVREFVALAQATSNTSNSIDYDI